MSLKKPTRFVVLCVLDGWGLAAPGPGNAISQANTINLNRFLASFPHTSLEAAGEAVGLPRGEAGNTETGHINLGAGRIVYQDLARINMAIADGSFFQNQALLGAIEHARKNNSNLHYLGLIGAGGVHSNIEHIYALLDLAKKQKFSKVFLHLFTDGRDSPPTAAKIYISQLRGLIQKEGVGKIASVMGRYWAMDRDLRWDRTQKAYLALTQGTGKLFKTPEEAIDASYEEGKTDEFIEPALIADAPGDPTALIKENDAVVFFNFRIDRPRQLTRAFIFKDFAKANLDFSFDPYLVKYQKKHTPSFSTAVEPPFERGPIINNLYFVTMTEYGKSLAEEGAKVAFPPERVEMPLGRIIAEYGYKQLRAAESEKERFVTFYFNGQQEISFENEEHLILPSPKVATYDLIPEMSARQLTEAILDKLRNSQDFKFILVNYANVDMVGHTGNIGAAVKACEVVDECVGKLADYVQAYDGTLIVTADHGNTEEMIDAQTGEIEPEHSSNTVPFVVINKEFIGSPHVLGTGVLADVAPTTLSLLGIDVPSSMTGRNLLT